MLIITIIASFLVIAIPFFMHHVAFSKSAEQKQSIRSQIIATFNYWKQRPVRLSIVVILLLFLIMIIIISTILQLGADNNTINFYSVHTDDSITVTIKNGLSVSDIYYTIDGSDPDDSANTIRYENPFTIQKSCTIIAARKWLGMSLCQNSITYTLDKTLESNSINTPVPITDTPVPVTDTPVPITDTPVPVTDTPVPITDTPVPVTDTPVPVTDTPAPITDTPVPVTDTPVPVTDTPVPVTDTPNPYEVPGKKDISIVPDVVHMSLIEAQDLLWRLGFGVAYSTDSDMNMSKMYVYEQSIPAGIELPTEQSITLEVLPIAPNETTIVPNVVGKLFGDAETILENNGLSVTMTWVYGVDIYKSYVLAQSIPANTTALAGTNVHLILVAKKPSEKQISQAEKNTSIVPNVINMTYNEAQKLLKNKGFSVEPSYFTRKKDSKLYVLAQSIRPDTVVPTKTRITLSMLPVKSNENTTVPNVINMEQTEAREYLANYGLFCSVSWRVEDNIPDTGKYYVKYQGIPAGNIVQGGTTIPLELTLKKPD